MLPLYLCEQFSILIPHEDKLIPLLFPSISSSLLANPSVAGAPHDLKLEREREFSAIVLTLDIYIYIYIKKKKMMDVSDGFTKKCTGKTIVFHVFIY